MEDGSEACSSELVPAISIQQPLKLSQSLDSLAAESIYVTVPEMSDVQDDDEIMVWRWLVNLG